MAKTKIVPSIIKLIGGLKVLDVRSWESEPKKDGTPKRGKLYQPMWILFDDGKTYIELGEQDYYSYHDCSSSARHIEIRQNSERWQDIKNNLAHYPRANYDV